MTDFLLLFLLEYENVGLAEGFFSVRSILLALMTMKWLAEYIFGIYEDFSPVRQNSETKHCHKVDCSLKTVLPIVKILISDGRSTNWLQNDRQ